MTLWSNGLDGNVHFLVMPTEDRSLPLCNHCSGVLVPQQVPLQKLLLVPLHLPLHPPLHVPLHVSLQIPLHIPNTNIPAGTLHNNNTIMTGLLANARCLLGKA